MIDTQLKTEFISALQPALGKLSALELRPNEIVTHNTDMENAMNDVLSEKWGELRGIQVVSVALGSVTLPEEDQELIKKAQRAAMLMNPTYAAATVTAAQADAMVAAANNEGGAMAGFMGMGMAMNAGGNAANLYAMGQQQPQQPAPAPAPAPANGWTCACGTVANGNFCPNCGAKKPEEKPTWTCECGSVNTGNFCPNCGAKKPEEKATWTCSCGAVNEGNFCPNCGNKRQ